MTDGYPGGKVYLIGAGPGSPDLMTVKAARLIEAADTILYDSLISEEVRETFPPAAATIDVGKRGPGGRTSQEAINQLLVQHARAGETVARLKGGDPHVYGRGGEEAQHLAAADVPFEIVPGVTSLVAAPGVVGIPLTHREHASAVTVITGHEAAKEDSALEWSAIAETVRTGGTLVILMGVRTMPRNVARLREAGLAATTPVAMVERATWADETTVSGTLETIVEAAETAGIAPPAITVVGDVVDVKEEIAHALHRDAKSSDSLTDPAAEQQGLEDAPIPLSRP